MRVIPLLLLGLAPACVIDKNVGDDPETAGVSDSAESSSTTDPTTSTSGYSTTSTTSTTGGSVSASSTNGYNCSGTPTYEACGVDLQPITEDSLQFEYDLSCEGGTSITWESSVSTDLFGTPELGDCLCQSINCGNWTGDSGGEVGDGGADSGTTTGSSCGYDPLPSQAPGDYNARCVCETCEFFFEDISEEDVSALDDEICGCLCEQGDCGGVQGFGEATSGGSTGDVGDSSGTTSTSG